MHKSQINKKWFTDYYKGDGLKWIRCVLCEEIIFNDGKVSKRVKCPICGNRRP